MTVGSCFDATSSSSHCDNENSQSRSNSLNSEDTSNEKRNFMGVAKSGDESTSLCHQSTTKVYYHITSEIIPYCAILNVPPESVTLGDFKRVFSRPNFKYFCKVPSPDSEISEEVKVEVCRDEEPLLRSTREQFELYLESCGDNSLSDSMPDFTLEPSETSDLLTSSVCGKESYCRSVHRRLDQTVTPTETDSYASCNYQPFLSLRRDYNRKRNRTSKYPFRVNRFGCKDSAIGSDTEARLNTDDDDEDDYYDEGVSTSTDITSVSRQKPNIYRKRCSRKKFRQVSQSSFYTSIPENSMSMEVLTITLNLDIVNYLGISIVGQSSLKGDNGIYVANVIKGGAVALDGRIEPGDMIIQVNDIALDNFTNDQAVDVLKGLVARKGLIKLTVAKMWDGRPRSNVSVLRREDEPVRPIDLNAWIQHTNAMRGLISVAGSFNSNVLTSGSCISPFDQETFSSNSFPEKLRWSSLADKVNIVRIMGMPGSGLKLKDHIWLKMIIPNSFLGTDLIEWLLEHVEGINDRKQAREFAGDLLAEKLIIHFVDIIHFTEKCYYTFGELIDNKVRNFESEDANPMKFANHLNKVPAVGLPSTAQSHTRNEVHKFQAPYAVSTIANKS